MEFVYLVRDRLTIKQRIIIFKHRDETEASILLRKFKGDDVFLGCVARISTVCIKCIKTNYLTNTPESENAVSIYFVKPTIVHKVHSMKGQRKEYLWYVCLTTVTYIRVTRNFNTIPILNSNNTVLYLTQVNEGNSISFIYTVGFYRCFGIHSVISLCLPKLLTPLYTPKLYNNDNYESLDILVYEY